MTADLICLLILALWSIPLNHAPALGRIQAGGVEWGLGNRETTPSVPLWVGRADRAKQNHHDNLAAIAIVILIAQVTGQTDGITAIASVAIVILRILHSLTYIFGIPVARTLAYAGALLALGIIVLRIFI
ncbi:MAPEG family protein [Spirulina sp. 06S082]|uniref:MAPEG family protein n=1 Tax=Spirulina sp. 06S082 TaxID=3110248 RepID=UPI002B1FEF15|nr:MAPEG family protein [Spirulina sp. 06S082]MEA5469410.1 MAPEG family protein [Spirulina sp. 06S082]